MHAGVTVNASGSERIVKPKLLLAVFDLPAKAAATCTKQYNGEYGCLYCLDKDHVHARARIYTPDECHNIRTNDQIKKLAEKAERTGREQYYGVKGVSILSKYIG